MFLTPSIGIRAPVLVLIVIKHLTVSDKDRDEFFVEETQWLNSHELLLHQIQTTKVTILNLSSRNRSLLEYTNLHSVTQGTFQQQLSSISVIQFASSNKITQSFKYSKHTLVFTARCKQQLLAYLQNNTHRFFFKSLHSVLV